MAYDIMRSDRYRSVVEEVPSGATKIIGTLYLINSDSWAVAFSSEDNSAGGEGVGDSIAAGKDVVLVYNCDKIMVAKAAGTGTAISVLEKVYVDHAVKDVYNTNAGDRTCIGVATEPASDTATTVEIDLKGDSMTDQP